MVAFIIAVALSVGFYQFICVPEAGRIPSFPKSVIEPDKISEVTIAEGTSNKGNGQFYVPTDKQVVLGISNRVVWHNADSIAHTVTSDDGYKDAYSGVFDSRERTTEDGGPYVLPGKNFEFLFTRTGEYSYHCEPHPHMVGKIIVAESFS